MRRWSSAKARDVLKALERIGWRIAFHDRDEIGPKMLTRISKHTGLTPEDL
jgi:predicted RNA binding protein YcfA (HicA-like mRNA interferase family)